MWEGLSVVTIKVERVCSFNDMEQTLSDSERRRNLDLTFEVAKRVLLYAVIVTKNNPKDMYS